MLLTFSVIRWLAGRPLDLHGSTNGMAGNRACGGASWLRTWRMSACKLPRILWKMSLLTSASPSGPTPASMKGSETMPLRVTPGNSVSALEVASQIRSSPNFLSLTSTSAFPDVARMTSAPQVSSGFLAAAAARLCSHSAVDRILAFSPGRGFSGKTSL